MELNEDLQSLVERAGNLHDRINEEINNSVSFCNSCFEHGWFCKISETPFEERERLIAIRDSLKEVQNLLIYLQKLRSWQLINSHVALNQLEESRSVLIEKVSQYQGRRINVIGELKALLDDAKTGFGWNLKNGMKKTEPRTEKEKNKTSNFVLCCIRFICRPCGWQKAFGTAAVVVISLTLYSTIHSCRTRRKHFRSSENIHSYNNSTQGEEAEAMLTISKSRVNVLCGKG
ncbi:hypothetical protein L6164_021198 [Bauhinia variegata]|uniref:Uncharacterized protein n=1 Tax=Bauhinia variegata TaxID=167791 RepID=A0ACB9MZ21_BAUVA|nr:hypothetical protein L6164_021198 [Bauhinia variegata]